MQISISSRKKEEGGSAALSDWIKARAFEEGFDAVGIAAPDAIKERAASLYAFLKAGYHGGMDWLAANAQRRAAPQVLWPDVRSIVMLGLSYGPQSDPRGALQRRSHGAISVYAQGLDYHDVIKKKLKAIARDLQAASGADAKVFADTAPLMEKPLAEAAGLGWQGKHTNLVAREHGSWLFLGAILTTVSLTRDRPEADHCGTCRRCLDICPTQAFPAPYRMDARRCLSYLTIEHKGQIPESFRAAAGNRIYGCDDCLAVCPWNKFASEAREAQFHAKEAADNPPLSDLLGLDDTAFRTRFKGSPIKRIGRDRFLRNVLMGAGNSSDAALLPQVRARLHDPSPLVRGMAVWALSRLAPEMASLLKESYSTKERDESVLQEWDRVA